MATHTRKKHRKKDRRKPVRPKLDEVEVSPKGDVPEAPPPDQAGDPFAGLQPLD